jgi:hypothetical protein
MTNNDMNPGIETKPSDGSEAAPFVCDSTLVTRATAELNEEILEELSEEDRSIASVLKDVKNNPPLWTSDDRGSNATDA